MRRLAWLMTIVAFCATWAPLAHVLELPNKIAMDGALWLGVQQHLYNGWGPFVGAPAEIAGLALSMLLVVRADARLRPYFIFAALMYAGMLLAFFLLNDPVNRALAGWTPQTLPANWPHYRMKWELGHSLAALFSLGALIAVVLPLLKIERGAR